MGRTSGKTGIFRLKPRYAREARDELEVLFRGDVVPIAAGLAMWVIANSLGREFWAREMLQSSTPQPFINRKYINRNLLALMLWRARDIPGFEVWLRRARNDDIEGAFFELYWITYMRSISSGVAFNAAIGKKGLDYDFYVFGFEGGPRINIEVKTRVEPLSTRTRARRFLDSARSQLPAEGLGAIVFRLAPNEDISAEELSLAITTTIKNSARLAFVIHCSDLSNENLSAVYAHAFFDESGMNDNRGLAPGWSFDEEALIAEFCS